MGLRPDQAETGLTYLIWKALAWANILRLAWARISLRLDYLRRTQKNLEPFWFAKSFRNQRLVKDHVWLFQKYPGSNQTLAQVLGHQFVFMSLNPSLALAIIHSKNANLGSQNKHNLELELDYYWDIQILLLLLSIVSLAEFGGFFLSDAYFTSLETAP